MTRRTSIVLTVVLCAGTAGAQAPRSGRQASADFVGPGPVVPLPAPIAAAVAGLKASSLEAHIAFLASPALEGRGLGELGLESAAEYVAAELALAGVAPAGVPGAPGRAAPAYFQAVPLREISHPSCQVAVERRRGSAVDTREFRSGVDVVCPERPPGALSAPVVFAGYGIQEPEPPRDDYRGLDVRDKVVLLYAGVPPGPEWKRPELVTRYAAEGGRQRFTAKARIAAALGARAVLAIEGPAFASAAASHPDTPAAVFFTTFDDNESADVPVIRVTGRVADAMLSAADLNAGSGAVAPAQALAGVTSTVTFGGDERSVASRNVIGTIRGSDPVLREEAVIVGAHMDHLGKSGDKMYPGADDNASGVAALLEIAKAFAASGHAPRRTLIFAFWTGEEEGHLGSVHYVRHPVWPLERTSVYLNLDMIGHPWTAGEVKALVEGAGLERGGDFVASVKPADFVELGVADREPALAPVLVQAARGMGLALHLDWTDGKSGGSDYRDFARKGRPFVRFFGNYFDGYHEPADMAEKLDAGQVLKMARLALASAWLFADR
jgi:hypothetical protein